MRNVDRCFGPAFAVFGFAIACASGGCEKEKSNVEKLADEIAASNSATKVAASASASKPDPAEQKYKDRKASLEKTVTEMKADEAHVMAKDPAAGAGVLRKYFATGPDAEKDSKELEAKYQKSGVDGIVLKLAKIEDTRLAGNLEDAELDVVERDTSKGADACVKSTQTWKWLGEKWIYVKEVTAKKVDCE